MRSLVEMDTIQIEVTNACIRSCSNCTRFCGHFETPYFMEFDFFKDAVDSMVGFPNMVGMMGGEPLLHPRFEELCIYMVSKIPKEKLGLWTAFPRGYEKYREIICSTFGNIFLNDHGRPDIYHHPLLVAAQEVMSKGMYQYIDHCWVQNSWSAAINPNGAFFCEVAAAFSLLRQEPPGSGWSIYVGTGESPEWWMRTPKDFTHQIERYCSRCGGAMPLKARSSLDGVDDISPDNLEFFKPLSKKLQRGEYVISDLSTTSSRSPMGAYKDSRFRDAIAARYGIGMYLNQKGFQVPYLLNGPIREPKESPFESYVKDFSCVAKQP